MKKKYVLKDKKRFAAFISLVIIITASLCFAITAYGYKQPEYVNITVRNGDTLWEIAEEYCSKYDIRRTVYEIKKANNLKDGLIYIGQHLNVPVYD